jgi:hypothetical protein
MPLLPSPKPAAAPAASLADYLTDRRDERRITLAVLAAYLTAALYTLLGHSIGLAESKLALDSLEALAMVVVVAHVAGGVAQRAIAQRAIAQRAIAKPALAAAMESAPAGREKPAGTAEGPGGVAP